MIYQKRTGKELIAAIDQLNEMEGFLDHAVELRRVVIDMNGNPVRVISRGFFMMPLDWEPTPLEQLLPKAKGCTRGD